jgi:hypothetical protein
MGQGVYIIDLQANGLPEPTTLEEMWTQIENCRDQTVGVNQRFMALAMCLERKFVTNETDSGMSLEELGYPLIVAQSIESPVWNFGLPSERPIEVLHELVRHAAPLQLAVLVDHLGVGFLPGKKIIPASVAERWAAFYGEAPKSKKLSKAQVVKKMKEMLGEKLAPHGFELIKETRVERGFTHVDAGYFRRNLLDGWQLIEFYVGTTRHHGLTCYFTGGGVNNTIHTILKSAPLNDYFKMNGDDQFSFEYLVRLQDTTAGKLLWERQSMRLNEGHFSVEVDDVIQAKRLDILLGDIVQILVPHLDQMTDVVSLDHVLNKEISKLPGSLVQEGANTHVALVCAHLTSDRRFDDILDAYIKTFGNRTDDLADSRRAEMRQLANFLREHVAPLALN